MTALVEFIELNIRPYTESDLEELIEVYQSAFAEPPWNEYMKCVSCSAEYGIEETESLEDGAICKRCKRPLN